MPSLTCQTLCVERQSSTPECTGLLRSYVKFYCNVDFSIIFGSDLKDKHLESSSKTQLTAPDHKNQDVVFPAGPHEGAYRVKIKFRDIPEEGFKYTVRTANGDLDPRVVPPR
jgi:hypothetical protein